MSERTRPSSEAVRRGRLKKAVEFLDGAILIEDDMPDAAVALLVNAGIAAADVICGVRLGIYAAGENHNDAVALLAKADTGAEKHLRALLNVKSKVSYTHQSAPWMSARDRDAQQRRWSRQPAVRPQLADPHHVR